MRSHICMAVFGGVLASVLLPGTSQGQYAPSFSLSTIDAVGSYDVQGTAVGADGTIYLLDPVCDRVFKTDAAGMPIGSFSTEGLGCRDGRGLAIDSALGILYLCDPVEDRVYLTTLSGVFVASFSTEFFGCFDVEGADFDPGTRELYLLDPVCDRIFVTSPSGTLLRFLSTEAFGSRDGAGLACDPARGALLVVDPVLDRVFEVSAATGSLYRVASTETYGLFDARSAGFLSPSTLVVTDPVCDVSEGFGLPVDLADHNIGHIVLTMTDQGSLGFLDDAHGAGSGLVYPAGQLNRLFIGSLWVGRDAAYVANRDYSADPAQEWTMETDPSGGIQVLVPGVSADQEIRAGFADGLGPMGGAPLDLHVQQESWAFATPPDDQFVIIRYFIQNRGTQPLVDLRAGLFLDVDIDPSELNIGDSDAARQAVAVAGLTGLHVGAALLEGDQSPDELSNLTLIHNPTFVDPQHYILDADKFGFLSASDPAHSVPSTPTLDDYGLLVSAGPFSLAPGASNEVVFAITGGASLGSFLDNVDLAQVAYLSHVVDVSEVAATISGPVVLASITPNPFNPTTTIRYDVANGGEVRLVIYDLMGRAVRTLFDGFGSPGRHALIWDGRSDAGQGVTSGVYFLRLEASGGSDEGRLVMLK